MISNIIDSLYENRNRSIEFPTEDEAREFSKSNGLNYYEKNGSYYVDVDNSFWKSGKKKSKNSYPEYPGLENMTDSQIEKAIDRNWLVQRKNGTYWINWDNKYRLW